MFNLFKRNKEKAKGKEIEIGNPLTSANFKRFTINSFSNYHEEYTCPSCGSVIELGAYCKFIKCPYCDTKIKFKGFDYKNITGRESMYASAEAESDCPACRGTHMFLFGNKWKCADCGFSITDAQLQNPNSVLWFCDSCETFLNVQDGFTDKNGKWKCKICGHENDVSKNNVY